MTATFNLYFCLVIIYNFYLTTDKGRILTWPKFQGCQSNQLKVKTLVYNNENANAPFFSHFFDFNLADFLRHVFPLSMNPWSLKQQQHGKSDVGIPLSWLKHKCDWAVELSWVELSTSWLWGSELERIANIFVTRFYSNKKNCILANVTKTNWSGLMMHKLGLSGILHQFVFSKSQR